MNTRKLSIIAGLSYVGIFFLAIYANFFVLERLVDDPVGMVANGWQHIRFGVLAFLVAAALDVVVAWVLYELYKKDSLSMLAAIFRVMHATLMGAAVFALMPILTLTDADSILAYVAMFNTLWMIGLFFFGFHLILLANIVKHIRVLPYFLAMAGFMYVVDTLAQFGLSQYEAYADVFLMLVAVPSVFGEMSFGVWLLFRGGKKS